MTPFDTIVNALRERGSKVRLGAGGAAARAQCPAHGGDGLSLSIAVGRAGGVLLHCHSHGCSAAAVTQALGLRVSDLFPHDLVRPGREPGREREDDAWQGVIPCIEGALDRAERAIAGDEEALMGLIGELQIARRAAVHALRLEQAARKRAAQQARKVRP